MGRVDWFAAASDNPGWCWYRQFVPEGLVALAERVLALVGRALAVACESVQVVWVTYEDARVAPSDQTPPPAYDGDPFFGRRVTLLPCRAGGSVPGLSTQVMILNATIPSAKYLVHAAIEEVYHLHQHRTWPQSELADRERCETDASESVAATMPRIIDALRATSGAEHTGDGPATRVP